jgi:hypothetical protein
VIEGLSEIRWNNGAYVKYLQALNRRAAIIAGIPSRVNAYKGTFSLSPLPISRQEQHFFWGGKIEYTHEYSSEPRYQENNGAYKSFIYQTNCEGKARSANFVEVINNPIALIYGAGHTQINQTMSANFILKRIPFSSKKTTYDSCVSKAKGEFGTLVNKACGSLPINVINSATTTYEYLNDVKFDMSVSLMKGMESR